MSKKAWVTALRMLAARRLSEVQLRDRLSKKDYPADEIEDAIRQAQREGYIDDSLYATLYIQSSARSLGNRRLYGNLIRRGIPPEIALEAVNATPTSEEERIAAAYAKLKRQRPNVSFPSAARGLERLGFATPAIYRFLQVQGSAFFEPAEEQAGTDHRKSPDSLESIKRWEADVTSYDDTATVQQ